MWEQRNLLFWYCALKAYNCDWLINHNMLNKWIWLRLKQKTDQDEEMWEHLLLELLAAVTLLDWACILRVIWFHILVLKLNPDVLKCTPDLEHFTFYLMFLKQLSVPKFVYQCRSVYKPEVFGRCMCCTAHKSHAT